MSGARRDRMVHARLPNGLEIARYDRAGRWYEESPGQRKNITVGQAVERALMPGAYVFLDLPGGGSFDAKVRRRRGFLIRAVLRWLHEQSFYLHDAEIKVTAKKPPCLIYLDDRAVRFEGPGTFPTKAQIHAARPWNKRVPLGGVSDTETT